MGISRILYFAGLHLYWLKVLEMLHMEPILTLYEDKMEVESTGNDRISKTIDRVGRK